MRIHHVAFRTDDVARLEQFYGGVLGLAVSSRQGKTSVWLEAGPTILMLEERKPTEPAIQAGTMEIVTFAIDPRKGAFYIHRLAEAGVTIEDRTAFTLYIRDPDGRRIGLSAYPAELEGLSQA